MGESPGSTSPGAWQTSAGREAVPRAAASVSLPTAKAAAASVEGSETQRRALATVAPTSILDRVHLEATGRVSLGEILQKNPWQSNALNRQALGAEGATHLALRGLGASRTLVLVNGRRIGSDGVRANQVLDLDAIPLALVERVEILRDGGSARYGSDAIAGVVNVVTRRAFSGVEASAYSGVSSRGDAFLYDLAATGGYRGDRGGILLSVGHFSQDEVMATDRERTQFSRDYDWETGSEYPVGSTAGPQGTILDVEGDAQPGNATWQAVRGTNRPRTIYYNDPDEGWRVYRSSVIDGDLYNINESKHVLTPQQRYHLFSAGDHRFQSRLRGYFEGSYVKRLSHQLVSPQPIFTHTLGMTVSADSLYNPFGRPFRSVRQRVTGAGGRRFAQDVDSVRAVVGVEAQLPARWSLDLWFGVSRSDTTFTTQGRLVLDRLALALGPSFVDDGGTPTCGTPAAPIRDCVPLNFFGGEAGITPEMLEYVTYRGVAQGYGDMKEAQLTARGALLELPRGGPVHLVVGAGVRSESGGYEPDPLEASGNTTANPELAVDGNYDVVEARAELSAKVLEDLPFVRALELQGAARAFHYSTFGTGAAWQAGARWQVIDDLALRGTVATAFRAPRIAELFHPGNETFAPVQDPCDTSSGALPPTVAANCAAQGVPPFHADARIGHRVIQGGNADLDAETATIYTAGVVVQPRSLPELGVALDYVRHDVDALIQRAGPEGILAECYQRAQADPARCAALVQRDEQHLIVRIVDTLTNAGRMKSAGVDVSAWYRLRTAGAGSFRFVAEGGFLQAFDVVMPDGRIVRGKGVYDLGVHPAFTGSLAAVWRRDALGASAGLRYVHGFTECMDGDCREDSTGMINPSRQVASYAPLDVGASYDLVTPFGRTRLAAGALNVFDDDPPTIRNALESIDLDTYDATGRFIYARVMQAF